ncbi:siderophore biosynthesis protein IucA [Paenibacillus sp. CCS19]|uniref:IucA/IucC family protein n=1 Tax=Paenibacillus sp. CCS19 TaxID=3158387 RepID=UPI00255EB790|nr:IucA/IucC family protein [Paenibacillus cellulosilyticus]GMK37488.1 siderophore biosynthesis protein IucA [Paenibacillus cellulosilyticus]
MNKVLTHPATANAAGELVLHDLINAYIAEQFFEFNRDTVIPLGSIPELAELFPGWTESYLYTGDVMFLVRPSRRQGFEWEKGSPVYVRSEDGWLEIHTAAELTHAMLVGGSYPGLEDFIRALETAAWQTEASLTRSLTGAGSDEAPKSAHEWYVRAERIASLRDRPFHPTSKAKIGFSPSDYERYMAEFCQSVLLRWVAIDTDSVVSGSPADRRAALDALTEQDRKLIDEEMERRGLAKDRYTVIPVHPWQLEHRILPSFGQELAYRTIVVLDTHAGEYAATSSMRSMASLQDPALSLKLPVSVLSLGAARYLPVVKLMNGLVGERMFRQAVACDATLAGKVFLCEENLWWGYMPPTMGLFDEHPRHLAAQLRLYPQELLNDEYRIIPMAALGVVWDGTHLLSELFERTITAEEALLFYEKTASLFYDVALRLFKVGIVPELHGQNSCLVLKHDEPVGLLFRDHDSVRLHQPYLDLHGIADPGYRIRPGYSNSLYNETPEKLMFYIQTLGTQVNLASIMEAVASVYGVSDDQLWGITEASLGAALERVELPAEDKERMKQLLFDSETWPVKLIVRPLLETEGVPGAMPSGKGIGPNPFHRR